MIDREESDKAEYLAIGNFSNGLSSRELMVNLNRKEVWSKLLHTSVWSQ